MIPNPSQKLLLCPFCRKPFMPVHTERVRGICRNCNRKIISYGKLLYIELFQPKKNKRKILIPGVDVPANVKL